jgi:SAM-dependent methyltransferase
MESKPFTPSPETFDEDASDTSLERQSADAVVCIDALQMLPDREAALREAGSLLRDEGRIVLTTWELDFSPTGREPLTDAGQLVETAGLRLLLREEHPEWLERQHHGHLVLRPRAA